MAALARKAERDKNKPSKIKEKKVKIKQILPSVRKSRKITRPKTPIDNDDDLDDDKELQELLKKTQKK